MQRDEALWWHVLCLRMWVVHSCGCFKIQHGRGVFTHSPSSPPNTKSFLPVEITSKNLPEGGRVRSMGFVLTVGVHSHSSVLLLHHSGPSEPLRHAGVLFLDSENQLQPILLPGHPLEDGGGCVWDTWCYQV